MVYLYFFRKDEEIEKDQEAITEKLVVGGWKEAPEGAVVAALANVLWPRLVWSSQR
ncbi:hypothetical protein IWW50_004314, partial [Coemansia erecta]